MLGSDGSALRADLTCEAAVSQVLFTAGLTGAAFGSGGATSTPKKDFTAALHAACLENDLEMVKRLVQEEGIDLNLRDKNNWTPLHHCASSGHLALCDFLLHQKVGHSAFQLLACRVSLYFC
jgi:ankyrin repeat protein